MNTVALGLYTGSYLLRRRGARRAGRAWSYAGFGVLAAAAYLGGRLVYRDRIGTDHAQREPLEEFTRTVLAAELRDDQPRRVEAGSLRIVLVRRHGQVYALGESCAHLGGPLSEGEVQGDSIVCPWHGSRFALQDGRVLDGPATLPQPCFETREREGYVEVRRASARAAPPPEPSARRIDGQLPVLVPDLDDARLPLVAEHATGRAKRQVAAMDRRQSDPARGENSQDVGVGEERHVTACRIGARDDAAGALSTCSTVSPCGTDVVRSTTPAARHALPRSSGPRRCHSSTRGDRRSPGHSERRPAGRSRAHA